MEISLALGGGGIKGFAHIGVLRVLEREGIKVRAIAGTSIGGLIAGVYASGYSADDIETYLTRLDQSTFFRREPHDGPAMLGLSGVTRGLEETLGFTRFSDLTIPVAMTAVDMHSGELLSLQSGRVIDAILASIAVPGVFPPKRWNGRTLLDGGILDPVPVSLARVLAPGLPVVAVVLSPLSSEWAQRRPLRWLTTLPFAMRFLSRFRIAQALIVFFRSVAIANTALTDMRLKHDKPEVIVRPKTNDIGLVDRVEVKAVIELGEAAMAQALPEIHKVTRWSQRFTRKIRQYLPAEGAGHNDP